MSEPQATSFLAGLTPLWSRVQATWTGLSKAGRVLVGSTVGAALLLAAWLGTRSSFESYAPLFTDLRAEEAGPIVAKLRELKVPYRIGNGGASIEVPEERVAEVRLDLATSGMPGAEGEPPPPPITASEVERTAYARRALESSLGRTIEKIDGIRSARVHLAQPGKGLFVRDRTLPTASVLVDLRQGRRLQPSEVRAIVELVSRSVENLEPGRVALMSTSGGILQRSQTIDGNGALVDQEGTERAQHLATAYEDRVRSLLELTIGPGRVDVRVDVQLDEAQRETTEVRVDPTSKTAIVEEVQTERRSDIEGTEGVSGSEGNLPGAEGPSPTGPTPPPTSERSAKKNEISKVTATTRSSAPKTVRISAAVLVDYADGPDGTRTPRSREDLDVLAGLARSALGIDPLRGDELTVESQPFARIDGFGEATASSPVAVDVTRKYGPFAAGGVLVLAIAAATARSIAKKRKPARANAPVLDGPLILTGPDPAKELGKAPSSYRDEAFRRATEDPATAALVIRAWLGVDADAVPEVTVKA